jgi:hypothetical protein
MSLTNALNNFENVSLRTAPSKKERLTLYQPGVCGTRATTRPMTIIVEVNAISTLRRFWRRSNA